MLSGLPAIAIEGPRGVGKTATAERRARTTWHLDDPTQRTLAEVDPTQVLSGKTPILIDEWQHVPAVWDAVRRAVDRGGKPGSFILTGSSRPTAPPTHSGAGRIVTLRMRPMALSERGIAQPTVSMNELLMETAGEIKGKSEVRLEDYVREIVASGFPGIRGLSKDFRQQQLDGYISRIIDTDFKEQGHNVRKPQQLRRWIEAYATLTATTASFETIRDAATGGQSDKPSKAITLPYRDVLERLGVLDELPAWLPSNRRVGHLVQPPKHHLADPALAVQTFGFDERALLAGKEPKLSVPRDGILLEYLFESLVTLCVRVYGQLATARVFHLRQKQGRREIDLIVERADGGVVALEIKLRGNIDDKDVKHLLWLRERLGDQLIDAVVIHSGPFAYRRKDGIAVIPAALLGP